MTTAHGPRPRSVPGSYLMDAGYTTAHIEEDRRHWWFKGRLRILLAVLERMLPHRRLRLVDLGCGTGNVLDALGRFGVAVGMEPSAELAAAARARGLDVRVGALPRDLVVPGGWADVVLLLDVLEHIDDDVAALATARRALRPGGWLCLMVPAHPWLWSGHDVALGHRRRYTSRQLRAVVERAGFRVERWTYFNTLLLPAMMVVRAWQRLRGGARHDLRPVPDPVNRWLARLFALERHVVARRSLPVGASLLMIARR